MRKSLLIIEPNQELTTPYSFFPTVYPQLFHTERLTSIEKALIMLQLEPPNIIMLSASFTPEQLVTFLEAVKHACDYAIVPIFMVVDLSHPISTVLGTEWGGRMGVVSSLSTIAEFKATFERVTHSYLKLK